MTLIYCWKSSVSKNVVLDRNNDYVRRIFTEGFTKIWKILTSEFLTTNTLMITVRNIVHDHYVTIRLVYTREESIFIILTKTTV